MSKPLKVNVKMAVADSLQEVCEGNGAKEWGFSFLGPLPIISVSK